MRHTSSSCPSSSSSSSPSSYPQKGSPYRYTLLATVLLCLLFMLAVFLVTDHAGGTLPYWVATSFAPRSGPPPERVQQRGGDVTRPMLATVAPNPTPLLPTAVSTSSPSSARNKRTDPNLRRIELSLSRARASIRRAALLKTNQTLSLPDPDYVPKGPIYWNANAFYRSYQEMEKTFKVYVYEEGEPPLFHDGPCRSIYSTEGRFIHNLEMDGTKLRTRDPKKAHVHFLPFSVGKMITFLREPNSYDVTFIQRTIKDYIDVISQRYPFWNRSLGFDHFMISCHDWAPKSSAAVPELFNNSIRILCNANTSEGFNPSKDVTLPEMNLKTDSTVEIIGTAPGVSKRSLLGFFAGGLHGPIRPALIQHWKGKDRDLQVYEYLPRGISYYDMMKKSKFCLCPSGYEVASPRVVEAIYLECVPVIISDNYVLPFSDVLDWKAFSVQVDVKDIPNLKKILMAIPREKYVEMHKSLKMVQRHFVVSTPPRRFDMFHMLLHSVWLRRMNIRIRSGE